MSQQPGGYTRTLVGYDQLGKPLYRDEPSSIWTSHAAGWPVIVVSRETEPGHLLTAIDETGVGPLMQLHLCCALCEQHPSVFCLSPDTARPAYMVTVADVLAGILAHIRRSHPDVVAS